MFWWCLGRGPEKSQAFSGSFFPTTMSFLKIASNSDPRPRTRAVGATFEDV